MWFFISQINRASMEWLRCLPSPVTLCSGQPKKPLVNPFIFFTLFSAGVFKVLNTCSQKLSKHFERKFYADLGLDLFQGFLVYSLICGSLLFRKFPPWFIVFPATLDSELWLFNLLKLPFYAWVPVLCSGKNEWYSQKNSCIHVELTQYHFFQGMDSFSSCLLLVALQYLQTHFKNVFLLLLAGYSTVWYKQLCHYLKLEFYNQAWSQ